MAYIGLSATIPYAALQLASPRTIEITGDASWSAAFDGSADVSSALALASVATPGTYGSGSQVPSITIDNKGRVTSVTTNPVAAASLDWSSITNTPTTLADYGLTADSYTRNDLDLIFAKLSSPVFVGNPRAPTPLSNDNDTSIATTAFVQTAVSSIAWTVISGTPTTLTGYGITDAAPLAGWLTGTPVAPTAAPSTDNTQIATTAFVKAGLVGSQTDEGYQKFPSGIIVQWGRVVSSTSADTVITFPIPFPNAVHSISGSTYNATSTVPEIVSFLNSGLLNTSAVSVYDISGTRVAQDITWIAIGS